MSHSHCRHQPARTGTPHRNSTSNNTPSLINKTPNQSIENPQNIKHTPKILKINHHRLVEIYPKDLSPEKPLIPPESRREKHGKNRVFLSGRRSPGRVFGSGASGFVDRPESRLNSPEIGVWPPDMEDRTSERFGSHGFSRIRRVWLAGRGFLSRV
jgi:hypothetical protein